MTADGNKKTPKCVILSFPLPGTAREAVQPLAEHAPALQASVVSGRIVQTGSDAEPYRVVLCSARGGESQKGFGTMRAAEAYLRSELPMPVEGDVWRRGARKWP